MIDHLEANLNLIISEPDNIAARLVYADQLDEAGDSERAEFIRGQIKYGEMLCHQPESDDEIKPRTAYSKYCNDSLCDHCHGMGRKLQERCDDLLRVNEWKWTPKFLQRLLNDRTRRLVDLGWHNGFIEQITVTATFAWTGGPCCHDTVVWKANPIEPVITTFPQKDCKLCRCRGYVGGIGWDVVKQTPVRVVRVMDREPAEVEFGQFYGWHTEEGPPERRYSLVLSIWRLLSGWDQNDPPDTDDGWKWYKSANDANAALSRALIEFVGGCAKQVE